MLFELCRCPKCGKKGFSPNFELTVEAYAAAELAPVTDFGIWVSTCKEPPKRPDYFIFKCSSSECDFAGKMTTLETLQVVQQSWSEAVWEASQREARKGYDFEGYFTRYIIENGLHKVVSERDLDANPMLREYVNIARAHETGKPSR